jgi:hypothetical protein
MKLERENLFKEQSCHTIQNHSLHVKCAKREHHDNHDVHVGKPPRNTREHVY